jgi:hypothetical protein
VLAWVPAIVLAAGTALAPAAWAHGGAAPVNPFSAGARALAGEPACVLALLALALLVAQQGWPQARAATLAGLGALGLAGALAAFGGAADFTLELLALTLACGGLVAWARPLPAAVHGALGAAVAAAVVLVSMPAESPGAGFRLAWLAGVLAVVVLLHGNALLLLQAVVGRGGRPASPHTADAPRATVRAMLVRVAGSWLATAALLVLALEWSRRIA